jgi:hypothetical protein
LLTAAALAAVLACTWGDVAQAGIIPPSPVGVATVVGGGTASITGPFTLAPNNNPSTTTSNFASIQKTFTSATTPLDIVFNVNDSQGVTEYLFAEGPFNLTGIAWKGYDIQLGFGTGASFTLANPLLGLQFDTTPAPSSTDFPTAVLTPQQLNFSGGNVPSNHGASLAFTIDVPDTATAGSYQFTMREFPIPVPEPSAFVLAGLGIAGLVTRRWFRRR